MYLNPFIEEEHLDFGLFACNMTEDIEKRGKIYR
jgi:hypothetical protein